LEHNKGLWHERVFSSTNFVEKTCFNLTLSLKNHLTLSLTLLHKHMHKPHAQTNPLTHTQTQTHTHKQILSISHTHTHTHTNTNINTHTNKYSHTHKHTHILSQIVSFFSWTFWGNPIWRQVNKHLLLCFGGYKVYFWHDKAFHILSSLRNFFWIKFEVLFYSFASTIRFSRSFFLNPQDMEAKVKWKTLVT